MHKLRAKSNFSETSASAFNEKWTRYKTYKMLTKGRNLPVLD